MKQEESQSRITFYVIIETLKALAGMTIAFIVGFILLVLIQINL